MVDQPPDSSILPNVGGSEAAARRIKAGLAYICVHMQEIREDLTGNQTDGPVGAPGVLHDLQQTLAAGQQYGPALEAIHRALLDAGDVLGLYGRVHPNDRGLVPDGFDTAKPPPSHDVVYLCPLDQCSRYSWPQPGSPPRCAISGQALREDHL
ncbi:hypothetical protein OG689_41150 [Kitasatospora sp. NBC_00240]|uniref:hypothetical protein n=1 Tax=Kitasatospora sp. NBC_00240 TaxID=2903567 RepID=UPI00225A02BC|nr:hypothetical protein [Kitasatospora sp. NBC_00240]MCX5215566.1 hypothetical protein [Kitasatospora sp. NBC_00240]